MLTDKLQHEILVSLGYFRMLGANVWRNHRWTKTEVEFLNFCLNQKHLSLKEFQEAVEKRIIALGFEMYRQATPSDSSTKSREPQYADHVASPEALAFAILHKSFTPAQLGAICFDHGDDPETFWRDRINTLAEDIMKQLMEHAVESTPSSIDVECCHHD